MFVKVAYTLYPVSSIESVNIADIEDLKATVMIKGIGPRLAEGTEVIDLLMALCPSVLEGRRMRWVKRAWMVHNLIGHPLMQVASFFGQYKLAMRLHDLTVPRPLGRRQDT